MPRREGEVFRLGTAISVSSEVFFEPASAGDGARPLARNNTRAEKSRIQGRAYRGWDGARLEHDLRKVRNRRDAKSPLALLGPASVDPLAAGHVDGGKPPHGG